LSVRNDGTFSDLAFFRVDYFSLNGPKK
jgi:hypothetical protein